ncbi:MAG: MarR family transcriptional regulator [Alphaproteobacteria bacterium]|nr:MarR family transcriptional regulator [Alphaproteobacteria bacterium]
MDTPVTAAADRTGDRAGREKDVDLGLLPGLLGYQLRRAQLRVFQSFAEAMGAFEISPGQLGVLVIISENPGLNQTRLARALGIDRSTMVAVLDGLEQRDLLARTPSPTDRRSHALLLTKAGERLLQDVRPVLEAHEDRIAASLSKDERAMLLSLLRRINGR